MRRRILSSLLLAAMLFATLFAAPLSQSILAEEAADDVDRSDWPNYHIMTIFRPQHEDFNRMPVVQEILDTSEITVEWEFLGDAASRERTSIAINTGNLPDAMFGLATVEDIQRNTDLFMPLNDYIDTLPNVSTLMEENPEAKRFLTFPDGNIYSFPFVQEREYESFPDQLYINTTWLDALGLEKPTTIDEYADVLRAFKNDDPNGNGEADEIPLTMMINHSYFGFYSFYGAFGRIDEPTHLTVEDGKVIFTADKEEWKEATKWFAGLNAEGLLDTEGFTQDRSTLFAKGKTEPMIIGSSSAFLLDNVVGAERMEDYEFLLLEGPNGDKLLRYSPFPIQSRTNSVVSAAVENPDPLLNFFDVSLDQEKEYPLQTVFGQIGKQIIPYEGEGDQKFEFAIAPEGLSQDDYRYKDAPSNFPTYLTADSWASVVHAPDVARKEAILEEVRDSLQTEAMPPLLFLDEELDELADIETSIRDYVNQEQALWITNQADIDASWDEYLATLENMGLSRLLELYQTAYDRYYE